MTLVIDGFCGPGGATLGIHAALPEATIIGIDIDRDACRTHAAAGFPTMQANISHMTIMIPRYGVDGLWFSPPCTDFTVAGKQAGLGGGTGQLIYQARDWFWAINPQWAVFEQVPPVLPYWEDFADTMRWNGFYTWTGILNAADYGVPQCRQRAILLVSKTHRVNPPEPTHDRIPQPRLFGNELLPWVTMEDALPHRQRLPLWAKMRPAPTVMGDLRIMPTTGHHPEMGRGHASSRAFRVSSPELATLQGFPADHPWRGTQTSVVQQIGNAVPPRLAEVCLRSVA